MTEITLDEQIDHARRAVIRLDRAARWPSDTRAETERELAVMRAVLHTLVNVSLLGLGEGAQRHAAMQAALWQFVGAARGLKLDPPLVEAYRVARQAIGGA